MVELGQNTLVVNFDIGNRDATLHGACVPTSTPCTASAATLAGLVT